MEARNTSVVLFVLWWMLCSMIESTQVIDDDVAILVTSIASISRTTNRPTTIRNPIPRHPFLYKKDYKGWLGLRTGRVNFFRALHPSLSDPSGLVD